MSVAKEFIAIGIAVLTVSDTRTLDDDTSGQYLADQVQKAGHRLADRQIAIDDIYQLRAVVSAWIADDNVQAIIANGGSGITGRDVTPDALWPLLDREVQGFGELFRHLSFNDIGTSTVQSRALGGLANGTLIFGLPGSTGACRLAWEEILEPQLDARHRPCNFVGLMPRFME